MMMAMAPTRRCVTALELPESPMKMDMCDKEFPASPSCASTASGFSSPCWSRSPSVMTSLSAAPTPTVLTAQSLQDSTLSFAEKMHYAYLKHMTQDQATFAQDQALPTFVNTMSPCSQGPMACQVMAAPSVVCQSPVCTSPLLQPVSAPLNAVPATPFPEEQWASSTSQSWADQCPYECKQGETEATLSTTDLGTEDRESLSGDSQGAASGECDVREMTRQLVSELTPASFWATANALTQNLPWSQNCELVASEVAAALVARGVFDETAGALLAELCLHLKEQLESCYNTSAFFTTLVAKHIQLQLPQCTKRGYMTPVMLLIGELFLRKVVGLATLKGALAATIFQSSPEPEAVRAAQHLIGLTMSTMQTVEVGAKMVEYASLRLHEISLEQNNRRKSKKTKTVRFQGQ